MPTPERLHRFAEILRTARAGVALSTLKRELGCSEPTVHRVRRAFEEQYGVNVIYDRGYGGYRLEKDVKLEAPGLWLHPEELAGLLGLDQWLESLGAGVLASKLEPLREDLLQRVRQRGIDPGEWTRRIRLLPMHARGIDPSLLLRVVDATLRRRRLHFAYQGAHEKTPRPREVSPQRVVHYRDTWYLDALDHGNGELRCFALHRMRELDVLKTPVEEIPYETLDAYFAGPYGIFGGPATGTAALLFEGEAARIVNEERWHPQENRQTLPDGRLRLEFPCGRLEELTRDVLRFADEVTVEGPEALREAVANAVRRAAARMNGKRSEEG